MINNHACIINDLHIGQKNHNKGIFNSQMHFFREQFFPYLLRHDIKHVFHLGDLVHNRNLIDLWILQELKTQFFSFFEKNKITFYSILGNHDIYYRNTLATSFPKENLKEFEYVKVIDQPTKMQLGKYTIGLVPWIVDVDNYELPEKCDILMGHFDIQGMPMLTNIYSHDGYEPGKFKAYKHVFSGHYHIKSDKDNIHYVGTQYQLTWNDYGQEKGFYVLRDNYKFEYIINHVTPKFLKLYYTDANNCVSLEYTGDDGEGKISSAEAVELAANNYLKVYIKKCNNQAEFDRLYGSLVAVSKNDYKIEIINSEEIIEDYDFSDFESAIDAESTTIDLIMNYIEGMIFEKDVDKKMLITMSRSLYTEAQDESRVEEI